MTFYCLVRKPAIIALIFFYSVNALLSVEYKIKLKYKLSFQELPEAFKYLPDPQLD